MNSSNFNFKPLKIACGLIVGIVLMLLGRYFVEGTASTLFINGLMNGDTFLAVLTNSNILSLVIRAVGASLFVYMAYRAYCSRQLFTFKAFKKTLLLSCLLCFVVIMSSTIVEAPLVSANKVNTISQGYKLCISQAYYDYWIGQLSNDQYFAIRGSDGNAMTFVEPWQASPPWAAYASNYTQLEQQVFAATTFGTVYSKEVPLNYNLVIPTNVTFIESVNGLDRLFISASNSQGSPYTISKDTVNSGYYLAQDSADRFINSWSSLVCVDVMQSANNAMNSTGGVIQLQAGQNFTFTKTFALGCHSSGPVKYTLKGDSSSWLVHAAGTSFDMIQTTGYYENGIYSNYAVTIEGVNIDGKRGTGATGNGIVFQDYWGTIKDTQVFKCSKSGILLASVNNVGGADNTLINCRTVYCQIGINQTNSDSDTIVQSCRSFYNDLDGVSCTSGDIFVHGSSVYLNGRYGINLSYEAWAEISGNWIGQDEEAELNIVGGSNIWACSYTITGNNFALPSGNPLSRDTFGTYPIIRLVGNSPTYPLYGIAITGNNFWDMGNFSSYAISLSNVVNCSITGNTFNNITMAQIINTASATGCQQVIFDTSNAGVAPNFHTLTPSAYNWTTAPANLANVCDCNYTSFSGPGNTNMSTAWTNLGRIVWNLTTPLTVQLSAKVGAWSNLTSGSMNVFWIYSDNGSTWYKTSTTAAATLSCWTTESLMEVNPVIMQHQYVGLEFQSSQTDIAFYAKIYEVNIEWLGF